MIKPVLHIIFLFLSSLIAAQQNLVPNHSFEDTVHCPNGTNDPAALSLWYNPNSASPDYYNGCANNGGGVPWNDWGYQYAQEGNAYIGLVTYGFTISNYREYLQIQLKHKLEIGKTYCWSFWISLLDSIDFAANKLGIGLSEYPVTNFSSQELLSIDCIGFDKEIYLDRNSWKKVSGVYTATGQEQYLTLGNFFNDVNTSSVQVASNSIGGPGACYFIDNVFLGDCVTQIVVPNIFSPNNDGINDNFSITSAGVIDLSLTIVNRWGEKVFFGNDAPIWDGKYKEVDCSEGVYFYVCTFKNVEQDNYETRTGFIELMR